jgi:hypothetical protein
MFPGGGGRCKGERRCKAKQGRHGKTALTYESCLHNSTDFAPRTRGVKDLFRNTHLEVISSVAHLRSRISVAHLPSRTGRVQRMPLLQDLLLQQTLSKAVTFICLQIGIWQGCQISRLFHEDAQGAQVIYLSILPR